VYVKQARKQLATHLEAFDFPQMNPNCLERRDSTVAPQALYLMNNARIDQLTGLFAERVGRQAGPEPAARVERVYWIARGRGPTTAEKAVGVWALEELTAEWAKAGSKDAASKALASYCHALVNTAGFVYVD
jgi:hypothetical protein